MTQAQQSEAQRLAAICETKGMFPVADELNRMHARILELEQGKCLHQIAEPAAQSEGEAFQALSELTKALRERHYGRMPAEVQAAYDKAWTIVFTGEKSAPAAPQAVQRSPEATSIAPTFMTNDQAIAWAWADVRKEVGTENWTTGDSCNFYGFFLHGWNYRGQYELQRNVTKAAVMREIADADLAATQPAAQGLDAEPKLNAAWKARLLDGAPLSRDKYGCGSHPALPIFFEGVKCKDFFEALGIELRLWFAEYEMEAEAYEAMSDGFTEDGENYNAWTPKKPEGDGWCLVAIFDTEDGAACWWLRDAAFAAQAKQGGADHG